MTTVHATIGQRFAEIDGGGGAIVARTATRMLATLSWLPVWVATFTVLPYSLRYEADPGGPARATDILFGLALGIAVWAIGALMTNHAVVASRANPRSYADLWSRIDAAAASLRRADWTESKAPPGLHRGVALLAERLERSDPDPGWSSGLGYVILWRDLHRVEEALIELAPVTSLEALLAHDKLRIENSPLERKTSPVKAQIERADVLAAKLGAHDDAATASVLRPLLGEIRTAVDDYRDRRFESLVRERLMIERVSALLGLVAWAVLALAMLFRAPAEAVASVAAFYLIGVAAGLTTQLRGSSLSASHEDIYGYGGAHLRQTVLMAGLAGVAAAVLTWIVGQGGPNELTIGQLTESLRTTPAMILAAALGGLAPGALLDRMSAWAKTNLDELDSTLGGEGKATAGG